MPIKLKDFEDLGKVFKIIEVESLPDYDVEGKWIIEQNKEIIEKINRKNYRIRNG